MSKNIERDIEINYPINEFIKKLRRLAVCLETGKKFRIQIAGERICIPSNVTVNIEHERTSKEEEIEFQLKWKIR